MNLRLLWNDFSSKNKQPRVMAFLPYMTSMGLEDWLGHERQIHENYASWCSQNRWFDAGVLEFEGTVDSSQKASLPSRCEEYRQRSSLNELSKCVIGAVEDGFVDIVLIMSTDPYLVELQETLQVIATVQQREFDLFFVYPNSLSLKPASKKLNLHNLYEPLTIESGSIGESGWAKEASPVTEI